MNTIVTASPEEAAAFIRAGSLAAFPTETVYGLGADALRPDAVKAIFDAKGRPPDNPLIVHIAEPREIDAIASEIQPYVARLVSRFFPGPLTVVVKKSDVMPDIVTAGLDTVGIRMPNHPTALAFLRECDTVVAAPSANRSGRPSPTSWEAVLDDLGGAIPCILRNGRTEIGLESTVVDCTGDVPVVLRSGAVSLEELRTVTREVWTIRSAGDGPARSPGLRHRHYSPDARVVVVLVPPVDPPAPSAFIGLTQPVAAERFAMLRICRDADEYAFELFAFFRACDATGISTIYCELPSEMGIGAALADRLRRAAEA